MSFTTVEVRSRRQVLLDGVAAGSITDVLANHRGDGALAGKLDAAIEAWQQREREAAQVTLKAARDERDAARADLASARSELAAAREAHRAKIEQLESVLGGTDAGRELIRQKRAAERQAKREALAAEIAQLDAQDAAEAPPAEPEPQEPAASETPA